MKRGSIGEALGRSGCGELKRKAMRNEVELKRNRQRDEKRAAKARRKAQREKARRDRAKRAPFVSAKLRKHQEGY